MMPYKLIGKQIFSLLPSYNSTIYRFCKKYVDNYNSNNNDDINTNGEYRLLEILLPRLNLIFDVGANRGDWANTLLLLNPSVVIHCFEPSLYTFRLLSEHVKSRNAVLNNIGLGAEKGSAQLHLYGDGCGANSLYKREGTAQNQTKTEPIEINTIGSYCETKGIDRIDLLKIDVEGHELEVLRGASDMIRKGAIRYIQLEYGGTYIDSRIFFKDIWDFFVACNPSYSVFKIFPQRLAKIDKYTEDIDNFQYSNFLFSLEKNIEFT